MIIFANGFILPGHDWSKFKISDTSLFGEAPTEEEMPEKYRRWQEQMRKLQAELVAKEKP